MTVMKFFQWPGKIEDEKSFGSINRKINKKIIFEG
jgi:hypothetical protein